MKHFIPFLTLFLFACQKTDNNTTTPLSLDALLVNDAAFDGKTSFAVGQPLKLAPSFSSSTNTTSIKWTLSPKSNEEIDNNSSEITWRPTKSQRYTFGVTVQNNSGQQASKQYNVNISSADIRYYLWGARRADVEYSESVSLSEELVDEGTGIKQFIVRQTDSRFDKKDAIQPGEYVNYWFNNDRLSAADVYVVMLNLTDRNDCYAKYQELQARLADYNYVGQEHKWLETSQEAMQLKNLPERWGEALSKGYVTLKDNYENERTKITLETLGPGSNGDALIVLRYIKK